MEKNSQESKSFGVVRILYLIFGLVALICGLIGISFGIGWSNLVFEFYAGNLAIETISTYAPFFPFVRYYPFFLIMLASLLILKFRE